LDCDDADVYELRRLEDEDTGLADMESAPLDRHKDVRTLGITSFAMVATDESPDKLKSMRTPKAAPPRPMRTARALSLEMNKPGIMKNDNKCFVRIHCGEETHVLNGPPTMTLGELLPMISRKRMMEEVMVSHKFQFFYINDETHEVNMDTRLNEAASDDFRLVSKMPTPNFPATISEKSFASSMARLNEHEDLGRPFNKETASAYSEYTVIKTNARGRKQKRVFGVDGTTIYNKATKATVSRASRSIASVVSCQMITNKDMSFSICFTEGDKRKLIVREYQTETYAECRQIVSKITFLVDQLKREERGKDTSYL